MTAELSPFEVDAGWLDLREAASFQHYQPLHTAAARLIHEAQSDRRAYLGISQLDNEMRGISAGHLALLIGYSHSGKTLVTLQVVRHNITKRVIWFIPDEPAPLVLTKLASLMYGVPARELERRVAGEDDAALRLINETVEQFPKLAVFDRPLTPRLMNQGYSEVCDHWGEEPDLVIVDYLDLVQIGESLTAKADFIKAFGTTHDVPLLVLHQTSRTAGSRGQAMRIDSGNFGGETWATYQLGVWRKRAAIHAELNDLYARGYPTPAQEFQIAQLQREAAIHDFTVTVNMTKNKRPGGQLVEDGIDFELFGDTGQLVPLNGNLPAQYRQHLRLVEES